MAGKVALARPSNPLLNESARTDSTDRRTSKQCAEVDRYDNKTVHSTQKTLALAGRPGSAPWKENADRRSKLLKSPGHPCQRNRGPTSVSAKVNRSDHGATRLKPKAHR